MEDLLPIFVIALVLIFKATLGKKKEAVPDLEQNDDDMAEQQEPVLQDTLQDALQDYQPLTETEPENRNVRPFPCSSTQQPKPSTKKRKRSTTNIQLSIKNDARRAFIYSEIFNKKYNT